MKSCQRKPPDLAALPSVPLPPPSSPGVYFLLWKGAVVYVGMSVDVFTRVKQHFTDRVMKFDAAVYEPRDEGDLSETEVAYIESLKPIYNRSANLTGEPPVGILAAAANLAVEFLANTDEDGIPANQLFERFSDRYKIHPASFYRRIDRDPRIVWNQADWVYRLASRAA